MKLPQRRTSNARRKRGALLPMTNDECRMGKSRHSPFVIRHSCAAFTLAEVLAALVFMAIVIPVVVECLYVAS